MTELLYHYTTLEGLQGILDKGIRYTSGGVPTKLNSLIFGGLLPKHFIEEPAIYGMVCFSEVPPQSNERLQTSRGKCGLAIEKNLLIQSGARKVNYVGLLQALKLRLRAQKHIACIKKEIRFPDDKYNDFKFFNPDVAEFHGYSEYAQFLRTYSLSQHSKDRYQKEWRILQRNSYIDRAGSNTNPHRFSIEGWGQHLNFFPLPTIHSFICPEAKKAILQNELPSKYKDIPMILT